MSVVLVLCVAVVQCSSVGVGCTLVGGQFAATGLWTGCRGSNELSSVSSKIWADGRDLSDPMDTAAGLATANDRKKMVMITTIEVREQIFSQNYNSTPINPTQAPLNFFCSPTNFFSSLPPNFFSSFSKNYFFSSAKFFFFSIKFLPILHQYVLHQISDSP